MKKTTIILCLLLLVIFPSHNIEKSKNPTEIGQKKINTPEFGVSSVKSIFISINGNNDLHFKASMYNWPGDGSQFDPYIITHTFTGYDTLDIMNTDLFFVITNFSIESPSAFNFYLSNVRNSKIINNTLGSGVIVLENTRESIVENNTAWIIILKYSTNLTIKKNFNVYVGLNNSKYNSIIENHGAVDLNDNSTDNLVTNTSAEIYIDRSGNNSLINNSGRIHLRGHKLSHFRQKLVINNTIDGKPILFWQDKINVNISVNMDLASFYLINCSYLNLTNQNFGQWSWSSVYFCSNLLLQNNTNIYFENFVYNINSQITNNNLGGDLYIDSCSNISIINNWQPTGYGIRTTNCEGFDILNNTISGLDSGNCERFNFSHNTILSRRGAGLGCSQSFISFNTGNMGLGGNNNTILNNSLSRFSLYGNNNTILDNSINGPFYLSSGNSNTILDNWINGTFYLTGSNNRIINNSLQGSGLLLSEMSLESLFQNEIFGNTLDGVPIIYWVNVSSDRVPLNVNQIILINCWNVEVIDQVNLLGTLQIFYCGNLTVKGNSLFGGLKLVNSSNLTIQGNSFSGPIPSYWPSWGEPGLQLIESSYNDIHLNTLIESKIEFWQSHNNNVTQNYSGSDSGGPYEGWWNMPKAGIDLHNSNKNSLLNNTVVNGGFYLEGNENVLIENSAQGGDSGFTICGHDNLLTANIAEESEHGFYLSGASGNELVGNIARYNGDGIVLSWSFDNLIYFNKFIENSQYQAIDDEGFNNLFRGNYFSDHPILDNNNDNIVDIPYTILGSPENNSDPYPIVSFLPDTHALIPPQIEYPNGEEIIESSTIIITWYPALDSQFHTISYSVYYSSNEMVYEEDWILLENDLTTNNYIWSLEYELSSTSYLIKIVAECSEGVSAFDISDQTFTIITTNTPTNDHPSNFPGFLIIIGLMITISLMRSIGRKFK